jgi:hypothetical protein
MSKEMKAIPAGNLMSVAATKGITSFSALKEKTGVDRKTLRAINTSRPVKATTLQSIADRLRVPISHLQNSDTNQDAATDLDDQQYREINLQQLDGVALRKLASETDIIIWFLNIDQISGELEATLLKLRASLHGWYEHIHPVDVEDPEYQNDNLKGEISHIKTSAGIDKSIEELARYKLKVFGGTYLAWKRFQAFRRQGEERHYLPILHYCSQRRAALSISSEKKATSMHRVYIGFVPPQRFVESELAGIDFVHVDGKQLWFRENNFDDDTEDHRLENSDDVPF